MDSSHPIEPNPQHEAVKAHLGEIKRAVTAVWHRSKPPTLTRDDLVQVTLTEVLGVLGREHVENLVGLAVRIARRRAIDDIRRVSPRGPSGPGEAFVPEASNERLRWAIHEAVAGLSSAAREILRHRFVDGETLRVIGQRQGVTPQAVFGAIERALGELRRELASMAESDRDLRDALDEHWPDWRD